MDAIAVWRGALRRTYGGVRRVGGWRAGPRSWASASADLRCGLVRLAWRRLQAAWRYAESAAAHLPCRRHTGAILPRERTDVGGRAPRRWCRCRHERASWVARRRILARRVPADGGVGVRAMSLSVSIGLLPVGGLLWMPVHNGCTHRPKLSQLPINRKFRREASARSFLRTKIIRARVAQKRPKVYLPDVDLEQVTTFIHIQ